MVISRLLFPGHPRPGFTILLDLGFETGDIPLSLLELCRRGEEGEGRGCRVKVCETTAVGAEVEARFRDVVEASAVAHCSGVFKIGRAHV